MMTCREVANLIASDGLEGAWWGRRLGVRMHFLMCRHCRRYAAQLRAIGACARKRWGPEAEDSDTLQRLERDILKRSESKGPPDASA